MFYGRIHLCWRKKSKTGNIKNIASEADNNTKNIAETTPFFRATLCKIMGKFKAKKRLTLKDDYVRQQLTSCLSEGSLGKQLSSTAEKLIHNLQKCERRNDE
ncbi:unnamed protein product [Ceratitis capitata]|uniref:(Mediterranean fruit fly) hypothetical protein n=1 Tax=Ceratitis capitata TaxID=7213 RepID=A0A811U5K0_CERCA|nr:unnamed protein product [Ceratitis capitata]